MGLKPPKKIFISHSTKDWSFIEDDLGPTLRRHGIKTWYSIEDIHTAQRWQRMIKKGLEECDWFLVVLTENAVESKWVHREVNWWALEKQEEDRTIPLLLRDCDANKIDLDLTAIQYVDFRGDKSVGFKTLLKTWGKDFKPDNTQEKNIEPDDTKGKGITPFTGEKSVLIPFKKKSVFTALMILTILLIALTAIVWILLVNRNKEAETDYDYAIQHFGDTSTNFLERLIKASNSGNDSATIRLANYYYSKGLDNNVITAVQPLALKGDTAALKLLGNSQYNIGFALYEKKELKQAFDFFNKSVAANNNAQAECMLGIMYSSGQGTDEMDYNQALEWLVKSSNQNNDYAKLWLGVFYMKGYGVKKNIDTANKYFNWVVKNGRKATSHEASENLAKLNQN